MSSLLVPTLYPQLGLLFASALALLVFGCASKGANTPPGAQSPERRSDAEYDLARDLFYKGQPRPALDHALKAAELNEENAPAVYFASTIYLSFCSTPQGFADPDCKLGDAEKYARMAVKVDDQFRDAKNLLGQILILERKYPEAIKTLQPLVNDPGYAANYLAWGNLGWAQVLSGSVDEGIASLKNSVTQPRFCVGFYRLGVAYEKKGDFAQAEQNLTSAVEVESPDCKNLQDAWAERARVRMRLGKTAEGRADYEKCKQISTESQTGKKCVQELKP